MSRLRYPWAGIMACLIVSFLSACSMPGFLQRAEPEVAESEAGLKTRTHAPVKPAAAPTARKVAKATKPIAVPPLDPDLWRTIAAQFELATPSRFRSADPLRQFGFSPRFLASTTARAAPFLSYLYQEIKRRDLPSEILLIPLLESSFNNAARSSAGPAGLWQFIPATGERFGLNQSSAYDGRHDVIAATDAALDYFQLLGEHFEGDWLLAFAAYNCGDYGVKQAIERNRKRRRATDFWSLDLPAGTRRYVPRLLALSEIIKHPGDYGVSIPRISSKPYFEAVEVGAPIGLQHVAHKSGLYPDEFYMMNAAYRQRHTVRGQTSTILVAHGFGAEVSKLASTLPRVEPSAVARAANPAGVHVVASGDTLWDLARHYGIKSSALATANGLTAQSTLRLSQKLNIPGQQRAQPKSQSTPEDAHYRVRNGDSLWTIARRFDITVAKLKQWNAQSTQRTLQPGTRLVVR